MDNPRPEKVAVVDEVRTRLSESAGAILTEYRGLTVSDIAELRKSLEAAGGNYKVYKNTLVKLATAGGSHEALHDLLEGPTAIAFVSGEISAVAKALRDYARANPNLIVKGGMFGEQVLSPSELGTLADLPPRDVLLARLAGGIAAPLQQLAGLLQALPRNLAYGLSALIDTLPPAAVEAEAPAAVEGAEAPVESAEATEPAEAQDTESDTGGPATDEVAETEEAPAAEATEPAVAEATEPAAGEADGAAEETAEVADSTEAATDETQDEETEETKEQSENG